MPGPQPKSAALRQRRNRESTRALLPTEEQAASAVVPKLPALGNKEKWHPMVKQWWDAVWKSPMATEYLAADKEALYMLARLHQDFWLADTQQQRQQSAAEIRQQGVRFGLSPIDRRRLQWEVEKGDQAVERTSNRRQRKEASGKDPRDVLKVVG
jgi:hypothetical protein